MSTFFSTLFFKQFDGVFRVFLISGILVVVFRFFEWSNLWDFMGHYVTKYCHWCHEKWVVFGGFVCGKFLLDQFLAGEWRRLVCCEFLMKLFWNFLRFLIVKFLELLWVLFGNFWRFYECYLESFVWCAFLKLF